MSPAGRRPPGRGGKPERSSKGSPWRGRCAQWLPHFFAEWGWEGREGGGTEKHPGDLWVQFQDSRLYAGRSQAATRGAADRAGCEKGVFQEAIPTARAISVVNGVRAVGIR